MGRAGTGGGHRDRRTASGAETSACRVAAIARALGREARKITAADSGEPAAPRPGEVIDGRVVAVIDEDPFRLRALGGVLSREGCRPLLFDTPWAALTSIPRSGVDLIVIDRELDGCPGPSLARQMRRRLDGGRGPSLALACSDPRELDADEIAPFDHVLGKPVRREDLVRALSLDPRSRTATRERPPARSA